MRYGAAREPLGFRPHDAKRYLESCRCRGPKRRLRRCERESSTKSETFPSFLLLRHVLTFPTLYLGSCRSSAKDHPDRGNGIGN